MSAETVVYVQPRLAIAGPRLFVCRVDDCVLRHRSKSVVFADKVLMRKSPLSNRLRATARSAWLTSRCFSRSSSTIRMSLPSKVGGMSLMLFAILAHKPIKQQIFTTRHCGLRGDDRARSQDRPRPCMDSQGRLEGASSCWMEALVSGVEILHRRHLDLPTSQPRRSD